jgi:hypothetical protein
MTGKSATAAVAGFAASQSFKHICAARTAGCRSARRELTPRRSDQDISATTSPVPVMITRSRPSSVRSRTVILSSSNAGRP